MVHPVAAALPACPQITPATVSRARQELRSRRPRFVKSKDRSTYRRTISVDNERGSFQSLWAVPEGSERTPRASTWLKLLSAHPEVAVMRTDRKRNLLAMANALVNADLHIPSMTVKPGWKYLKKRLGIAERTIDRHLRLLEHLGFLGVVHTGRSDNYLKGQKTLCERAVYVLCVPAQPVENTPARGQEEKNGIPIPRKGSFSPTHAREDSRDLKGPATPDANPSGSGKNAAAASPQRRNRPVHECSLNQTRAWTSRRGAKGACLTAAEEIQHHSWALRGARPRFLAHVIKPYLAAGWTPHDMIKALDTTPDGKPFPHDGADGVVDHARWVQYRLTAWLDAAGTPLPSHSQRSHARKVAADAQRAAAAEQRAADQAQRGPITPTSRRHIDHIRGILTESTRKAKLRNRGIAP